MPTVYYTADEMYPCYTVSEEPSSGLVAVDIETAGLDVVRAYNEAEWAYYAARDALKRVLHPHCPECDHPQHRHQEWSKGWDYWGCLDVQNPGTPEARKCRCQHDIPEDRKKRD